jgi:hypothetical protein
MCLPLLISTYTHTYTCTHTHTHAHTHTHTQEGCQGFRTVMFTHISLMVSIFVTLLRQNEMKPRDGRVGFPTLLPPCRVLSAQYKSLYLSTFDYCLARSFQFKAPYVRPWCLHKLCCFSRLLSAVWWWQAVTHIYAVRICVEFYCKLSFQIRLYSLAIFFILFTLFR